MALEARDLVSSPNKESGIAEGSTENMEDLMKFAVFFIINGGIGLKRRTNVRKTSHRSTKKTFNDPLHLSLDLFPKHSLFVSIMFLPFLAVVTVDMKQVCPCFPSSIRLLSPASLQPLKTLT